MRHRIYGDRPDYKPKVCPNCGREANYAFNVVARTLGRGPRAARRMKMATSVILCKQCAADTESLGRWIAPGAQTAVLFLEAK